MGNDNVTIIRLVYKTNPVLYLLDVKILCFRTKHDFGFPIKMCVAI